MVTVNTVKKIPKFMAKFQTAIHIFTAKFLHGKMLVDFCGCTFSLQTVLIFEMFVEITFIRDSSFIY